MDWGHCGNWDGKRLYGFALTLDCRGCGTLSSPGDRAGHRGHRRGVAGYSVYFVTVQDLVQQFQRAVTRTSSRSRHLPVPIGHRALREGLHHPDLEQELLYWGSIFADNVIVSAILDRYGITRPPSTSRARATG
jgi:hypothetical protein